MDGIAAQWVVGGRCVEPVESSGRLDTATGHAQSHLHVGLALLGNKGLLLDGVHLLLLLLACLHLLLL